MGHSSVAQTSRLNELFYSLQNAKFFDLCTSAFFLYFFSVTDSTLKPVVNTKVDEPKMMSPQDLLQKVRAKLSSIENKLSTRNILNSQHPNSLGNSPELPGQKLSFSSPQSSESTQGHPRQTPDVNAVPLFVKESVTFASTGNQQQEHLAAEALMILNDNSPDVPDFASRLSGAEPLLSPDSRKSNFPAATQSTLNKLWSTPPVRTSLPPPVQRSVEIEKVTPEFQTSVPPPVQRSVAIEKVTPVSQTVPKTVQRRSKRKSTQGSASSKTKTGEFCLRFFQQKGIDHVIVSMDS
jgi:hypothetical protein